MKKRLPNKEFRKLVPKLRKKGFYNSKEKRPINWKRYNQVQTEEALELLTVDKDTMSIDINWERKNIKYNIYDHWVELWRK